MIRTTLTPVAQPIDAARQQSGSDALTNAMEGLQTARDQAESVISKYPAITITAAVAVGVALGCLIKRT